MSHRPSTSDEYFLGGADLEMVVIGELLARHAPGRTHDRGLRWDTAKASAYLPEIEASLAAGRRPVLVELPDDLPDGIDRARLRFVDHHGEAAGANRPTSLEQVFDLLGLDRRHDWNRRLALVAANDRGAIRGLEAAGASADEIVAIRRADRAAQGITTGEEAEALAALAARRSVAAGRLVLVRLPHDRVAPVSDWLDPSHGGPGFENLLVTSPNEYAFSGDGRLVAALADAFPGGWYGGNLPADGFWGTTRDRGPGETDIVALLESRLA
ncbi:MAG: hypothetical protein ACT7A5_20830 [Ferrovibrionaceae bacterium]